MARPKVDSLTYYNQDTKDDDNLQYVEAMHSFKGYAIIHKLWKHIYGSPGGYFCPWDKKNKIIFCQNSRITIDELDAIIETCYEDGIQIFDRGMTEKHGILTSKGIQKRWLRIVKECGRTRCIIDEKYNLLPLTTIKQLVNTEETTTAVQFSSRKPEENNSAKGVNSSESTQIKEKESKVNKNGCDTAAPEKKLNQNGEVDVSEKGMPGAEFIPPTWDEVSKFFFEACKSFWDAVKSATVARKFYNHFTTLEWNKTSGAPVLHWQSRAETWILEDRESDRKKVPRGQNTQAVDAEQRAKIISFIESVYVEFLAGTIKENTIPADIYNFLEVEELLLLSHDDKANMLDQSNGDEVLAKKKALALFFTRLNKAGRKKVFKSKN